MGTVRFGKPPLVEMVCAAGVEPMSSFDERVMLALYEHWRHDYPQFSVGQPTTPMFTRGLTESHFVLQRTMPARAFYSSSTEAFILAVDMQLFSYHWRAHRKDRYPHYERMRDGFLRYLEELREQLESMGCAVKPHSYLLEYVAHVPFEHFGASMDDLQHLLPWFAWPAQTSVGKVNGVELQIELYPEENVGHVVAAVRPWSVDGQVAGVRLETIARGPLSPDQEVVDWFNRAHERLLALFTNFTDAGIQRDVWERNDDS